MDDLLTKATSRVRPDLARHINIYQRARNFWAGVMASRNLGAADQIREAFVTLANDTGLTSDLVHQGKSFNGPETIDHLIRWGLFQRNPFGPTEKAQKHVQALAQAQ